MTETVTVHNINVKKTATTITLPNVLLNNTVFYDFCCHVIFHLFAQKPHVFVDVFAPNLALNFVFLTQLPVTNFFAISSGVSIP